MHHFEAMKSSNVHFTFFRMGKILEGLLAGSVEAEVPHGVECLRDAKHIWERLGGVQDQLKHGSFNSMLHAIEDLGHVIHDIANELEECKATVGTDLDKLREMSKAFTDPWYFIFHVEHDLIVNGQDIHHEIMDAQAQWENQHFYEYGHSLGLALSKIFLGGQMKNGIPHHALPVHGEHESFHYTPGHYANKEGKDDENLVHHTTYAHGYVAPHYRGHYYDNKEGKDDENLVHHTTYATHGYVAPHYTTGHYYDNKEGKDDENLVHHTTYATHGLVTPHHTTALAHDVVAPHLTTAHYANKEGKDDENLIHYATHDVVAPHHTTVLAHDVVAPHHTTALTHDLVTPHHTTALTHGVVAPHHVNDGYYTHHDETLTPLIHHDDMREDHFRHDYLHDEYHHEEPHHFIERMTQHEHHDEPRVVHDHPVHHEVPTHFYPHTPDYPHQEEPHVELEHEAHAGPVDHEYHTVVPHHEGEYYGSAHHAFGYEHPLVIGEGYHHYTPEHSYYAEASHHYYQ